MHSNALLRAIPDAEFAIIERVAEIIELSPRQQLAKSREGALFFVVSGVCELRLRLRPGVSAAIGLVGMEGVMGACHFCGAEQDLFSAEALSGMTIARVAWGHIANARTTLPTLSALAFRYLYSWSLQAAQTAVANAEGEVSQRVARWLLLLQDRLQQDAIALTHERLACSLNVRRASVTVALQALERQGVIANRRGFILIQDRAQLVAAAAGLYVPIDGHEQGRLKVA